MAKSRYIAAITLAVSAMFMIGTSANAQPIAPESPTPSSIPSPAEQLPSVDQLPAPVIPPGGVPPISSDDTVFENKSIRELTDPEEAQRINDEVLSKRGSTDPNARVVPQTCNNTRTDSCRGYQALIDQYVQLEPGAPLTYIGTWTVNMVLTIRSPIKTQSRVSVVQFYADVVSSNPTTTLPGTFTFSLSAADPGTSLPQYFPPVTFDLLPGGGTTTQFDHYGKNAVSSFDVSAFKFYWNDVTPAEQLVPPPPLYTTPQRVRCDNAQAVNNGTGCVNPNVRPTVYYGARDFPFITDNILDGQETLGYGAPFSSNPLTRGYAVDNRANRDAACGSTQQQRLDRLGTKPRPDQMTDPSCDEYPFASTTEGGFGSVVQWVPLDENNRQGTLMAQFYRDSRVMPDDVFYVDAYN